MYWNPKEEPMRAFTIKPQQVETLDTNPPTFHIMRKMRAEVIEACDDEIFNAIISAAQEAGITDLYLIDKEFIISAIKHEKERRGLC